MGSPSAMKGCRVAAYAWTPARTATELEAASGLGSSRGRSAPGSHLSPSSPLPLFPPSDWTGPILWGAAREGLSA